LINFSTKICQQIYVPLAVLFGWFSFLGPAGLKAQPGVTINFGPNGLSSLKYNNTEFLAYGDLRLDQVMFGSGASTFFGSIASTAVIDTIQQTQTRTYNWGSIVVAYSIAGANRLNLTVTVRNSSTSPIQEVWFETFGMRFPSSVQNYNGTVPIVTDTLGQPAVVNMNYSGGVLVVAADDVTAPLQLGFPWSFDPPTNSTFPLSVNTGTVSSYPNQYPMINRPIPPGGTDQYRYSLRFGPVGSTVTSLAGDVYQSFAAAFPPTIHWQDRRPIGQLVIATAAAGYPKNPRGWFLDPTVDVTTPAGVAAFQQRVLSFANNSISVLKSMNAQGMVTWDIEGQQFPDPISYVCDPTMYATTAPEMVGVADKYFQLFRDAGFRVGVCIRPQQFSITAGGAGQQIFVADPTQTLIDKATYAHTRWGATLFYIDSNVNLTDPNPIDPNIIKTLSTLFPDSLFIPEHSNTLYYAYSAPYRELKQGYTSTPTDVRFVYPNAFTNIYTADGPLGQTFSQLVTAVQQGDSLMYRSWYPDPQNQQVLSIYQAVSPSVSITLNPLTSSLTAAQAQQFTAQVSGSANQQVTWSISPQGIGSVSAGGLYTAPSPINAQQTVTVIATSQADLSKSASAFVTLNPGVAVTVSPATSTLTAGQPQQFSSAVSGSSNQQVTWSIAPQGIGSISAGGLYIAPSPIASQQTVTVKATSATDASKFASAVVTLNPTVAITVSPITSSLTAGQTQQFTATVSGSANQQVAWSVSPQGVGSISAAGLYTAPATIGSQQTVTVSVTSAADSSESASALVTLNPTVAVTINPSTSSLTAGQTQQFTATVTGSANQQVLWSVTPQGAGSISSTGLYSAPPTTTTPQVVTVVAASAADSSKSASAIVNLNITVVAACGTPGVNAFTGCYYQDRSFGVLGFSRVDPQINFNSLQSLTGPGVGPENFSVRWQGNFTFSSGTYTFTLATDDGSKLFVDGKMIIDYFSEHAAIPVTQSAELTAGTHLIQVDYFQLGGGASANLTWSLPAAVGVSVTPSVGSLSANQSQQFVATVTGSSNQQVSWDISPQGAGSVSAGGLYTAPGNIAGQQTVTVTATSAADTSKSASALITLNPTATIAVSVNPAASTLTANQTQQFVATVTGSSNQQVSWTVSPQGIGSISAGGLYTAPADIASQQTVTIRATSAADSSKSASGVVTLNPTSIIASSCAPAGNNVFTGCYYQDRSFTVVGFSRVDPQINFNWGSSVLGFGVGPNEFSVRWQGNFTFSAGNYTFTLATDDGCRLFVDGKMVIDYFSEHPAIPITQTVPLTAGLHLIHVDYFQLSGNASANLSWSQN
jgi:PA14 domain